MRREESGLLAPPEPASPPEEGLGWKSIVEWTSGLDLEAIEELRGVRGLESVYPLLHALLGRSPRDFYVRAAVLEALVGADCPAFQADDFADVLYWLDNHPRDAVLRTLRRAGWLAYDARNGTTITDAGRWAYDVLAFLHKRLEAGELSPTVAGVEYALDIGLDPLRHVLSMRSRLVRLREEMERARASHSEVTLRRAASRLDDALSLSEQIRAALDRIPMDNRAARRVAREIHDLLSRLHRVGADLEAAITAVGQQQLRLTAGLTVEQIVRALMGRSRDELAALGAEILLPVQPAVPLVTTEVVAAAAEQQFLKERSEPPELDWEEPPPIPEEGQAAPVPEDVSAWLAELAEVERGGDDVAFDKVIPRIDAARSFLRLSLLSLVGHSRQGAGVAGQLGALDLDVLAKGDGWPESLPPGPLCELTPGKITPRSNRRRDS